MERLRSFNETFGDLTDTWNPITGCLHRCSYCWAQHFAYRLASMGVKPYKNNAFKPSFAEWRLRQRIPDGRFIFVSDMGDMWGKWVPTEWIERVLGVIRAKPRSKFLFLTKNPARYLEFQSKFTQNVMLGATLETNRSYELSDAPTPLERCRAMTRLDWKHKAIVIEPILDFDHEFIDWIRNIAPEIVYLGYDNYNNRLPEPTLAKTEGLVKQISGITDLRIKDLRKAWNET